MLHFEQVAEDADEDADDDEMLDPSALLVVLGALARLTGGVAIDPQAGTFFGRIENVGCVKRTTIGNSSTGDRCVSRTLPMLAKDIKRGHIVNYNGAPCMIETINVQSPSARGAATFYKYRART